MKSIPAKFEGNCPGCRDTISVGQQIFKVGTKWVCGQCADNADPDQTTNGDDDTLIRDVMRLPRPACRTFLYLCGVAYQRHPGTVPKIKAMVQQKVMEDSAKAKQAYLAVTTGSTQVVPTKQVEPAKLDLNELAQEVAATIGFDSTKAVKELQDGIRSIVQDIASTELKKFQRIEVKSNTKPPKKLKDIMPEEFDDILRLAASRQNILLVGPSGCGKTFVAAKLAEALGLNFSMQSCSAGISESQLVGWLLPIGTSGKFDYVPSEFVKAYEKGGVFLLDEMDAADPQILMIVNAALANGQMVVPQRHKNPVVKRHQNFICVAAANTFGHGESNLYSGREMLDGSTLDRFRAGVVYMDYSPTVEEALVDSEILEWGRSVRSAINSHGLERIMSTRVLLDFTKLKREQEWTMEKCKHSYFVDWSEDERRLVA